MAKLAIKAGASGPKSVPTPGQSASFVLGSRPSGVRTPPVPRIKPLLGSTRAYGKVNPAQGNPFGDTSLSGRS